MFPNLAYSLFGVFDRIKFKRKIIEVAISCIIVIPFILNLNIHQTREWASDYSIKHIAYNSLSNNSKINIKKLKYTYSLYFYRLKIYYDYHYDICE